ncbi:hypothetical protein DSL72_002585 [Monilinia vaccinii-corymbosi]|uniref:Secreted protein n=1 Tax=Monilinia vaccinii-corymbosi TaxID=61207 RepID=A0A8A3PD34_9HELO|nr:hypothetical protein DSL72_002585 [Monilinia vaccinii-corymbosi]
MKLFDLSILAILSYTTTVQCGCFDETSPLGNPSLAVPAIPNLCKNMVGVYAPKAPIYSCHYMGQIPYEVWVASLAPNNITLTMNQCVQYLKPALECQRGGEFTYNGLWRIGASINISPCG